jgi:hypothetical protein
VLELGECKVFHPHFDVVLATCSFVRVTGIVRFMQLHCFELFQTQTYGICRKVGRKPFRNTVGNRYDGRRDDGKSVKILIDRRAFNVDGASLSRLIGSSDAGFIYRKSLTLEDDDFDSLYL